MHFDFSTALGFGASGILGGFAFPADFAQVAPSAIPGLENFGASGAMIGGLMYLLIQANNARVAEAFKFADRVKEMADANKQTIDNYQATTADLITRVLVHYERQISIPNDEE